MYFSTLFCEKQGIIFYEVVHLTCNIVWFGEGEWNLWGLWVAMFIVGPPANEQIIDVAVMYFSVQ